MRVIFFGAASSSDNFGSTGSPQSGVLHSRCAARWRCRRRKRSCDARAEDLVSSHLHEFAPGTYVTNAKKATSPLEHVRPSPGARVETLSWHCSAMISRGEDPNPLEMAVVDCLNRDQEASPTRTNGVGDEAGYHGHTSQQTKRRRN